MKIYIAGHTGLVGTALLNKYKQEGFKNIIIRTHEELDLTRQLDVEKFFQHEQPEQVILAAARVGGIHANMTYPAQFIYENILIQTNIIHSAYLCGVKKLLFLGSACSYPRECPQPMREEYLLSGFLEPTNEPYAISKIAGIKMCQAYNQQYGTNFICAIPTNTYGPDDNFNHSDSHVIPALIARFHRAKVEGEDSVTIWGTGRPIRDFMYMDDLADACFFLMQHYDKSDIINIGTGVGATIQELASFIKKVVGYNGKITFDPSKPDGSPRKVLDVSRLKAIGWKKVTALEDGLEWTYDLYIKGLEL